MKVYVTRLIPDPGIPLLEEHFDVEVRDSEGPITKAELLEKVPGIDGLLCLLTDPVDADVIAAGTDLVCISNYAVGFNNIDVKAATEKGIIVTNTPGVLTDTTADFAFCLLMAAARRVVEADKFLRAGKFIGWDPMLMLGADIHGKTLGIVGFGKIGRGMAARARGFGMKVLYHDAYRADEADEDALGAEFASLDDIFKRSDFISLHVPLTEGTRHLIGPKELEAMKPTAILINSSRGPVVDEKALAEALKDGTIAAAGLDVFENEPKVNELLLSLPNAVLAPHIASASIATRSLMAKLAAENMIAALSGEMPKFPVNPEVLDG
ncbi:MAG: D-glycerate dehydrogenase [Candidatus Coatesbacteria bacterium]|nr:D-glycerate dehydrogenase [Candidatus Coatesbacteria bacterium]